MLEPLTVWMQSDFEVAILNYKSYSYITAYEKALAEIAEKYGFTFERMWDVPMKNEYICDDRDATPEYIKHLWEMSGPEFEKHIEEIKKAEE